MEVSRPEILGRTALGAAYLAGVGIGFWKSGWEMEVGQEVGQRFASRAEGTERQGLRRDWQRALERAKCWLVVEE